MLKTLQIRIAHDIRDFELYLSRACELQIKIGISSQVSARQMLFF